MRKLNVILDQYQSDAWQIDKQITRPVMWIEYRAWKLDTQVNVTTVVENRGHGPFRKYAYITMESRPLIIKVRQWLIKLTL